MAGPWSSATLTEEIDHQGSDLLVASVGQTDNPVGYLAMRRLAGEAEILRLAVDPSHRNQGIAAQLLVTAFDILVMTGVHSCFLEVRADNDRAVRLYRRFSFRIVHRRPNYYRDGCAALVLAAETTGSPGAESS